MVQTKLYTLFNAQQIQIILSTKGVFLPFLIDRKCIGNVLCNTENL